MPVDDKKHIERSQETLINGSLLPVNPLEDHRRNNNEQEERSGYKGQRCDES